MKLCLLIQSNGVPAVANVRRPRAANEAAIFVAGFYKTKPNRRSTPALCAGTERSRGWAAAGGQIFTVAAFAKQSQFSPRRGTSRSGDEHPPGASALRYGAKRNLHKRRAATALTSEDENVNGTRRR